MWHIWVSKTLTVQMYLIVTKYHEHIALISNEQWTFYNSSWVVTQITDINVWNDRLSTAKTH